MARKDSALDETDVAPIPGSDLVLLAFEKGERTRVEAVDILTGDTVWKSDKIRGGIMQMAVEPAADLLAVVLVKDPKNHAKEGFRRHPLLHVLNLSSGDELWKYEVGETEMMPTRWPDGDSEVAYTLDNYRAPAFSDGRLYLFYEGLTSFDARTGKSRLREKYRVNEDGFALTEAEPIFDENFIYTSGHGRVRAISRESGDTSGKQGPWPDSRNDFHERRALRSDRRTVYSAQRWRDRRARLIWCKRDRCAQRKGLMALQRRRQRNYKPGLAQPVQHYLADRDDMIVIDSRTGKRRTRIKHGIERASFGVLNESGQVVVGGQSEIRRLIPPAGGKCGVRVIRHQVEGS